MVRDKLDSPPPQEARLSGYKPYRPPPPPAEVIVRDIKMPFWSMVVFMVKWAIASIPALIILAVAAGAVLSLVAGGGAFLGR